MGALAFPGIARESRRRHKEKPRNGLTSGAMTSADLGGTGKKNDTTASCPAQTGGSFLCLSGLSNLAGLQPIQNPVMIWSRQT